MKKYDIGNIVHWNGDFRVLDCHTEGKITKFIFNVLKTYKSAVVIFLTL